MGHIFISYKGDEESWAARLAETLESFGLTVWRDHSAGGGFRPGDVWKPELEIAIKRSDYMIVMWSQALKTDSTSVAHREISLMDNLIKSPKSTQKFVPVLLDDAPFDKYWPLAPYQFDISLQSLYAKHGAKGAYAVSNTEWYAAISRLLEVFNVLNIVEVPYVVAAMTRTQAGELLDDAKTWAQDLTTYEAVLALREKTVPFAADQYGDTPDRWRPFAHVAELTDQTIADLINQYDRARRDYVFGAGIEAKWVLMSYSADFLSPDPDARKRAREAMAKKCLVILDPMSLLHKTVYKAIVNDWGLQGRENAFVIGLAPFEFKMHADFEKAIPVVAKQIRDLLDATYDRFARAFDPVDQCVLEVGHQSQFARWLQVAADGIIAAGKSPLRNGTMSAQKRERARSLAPKAPNARVIAMAQGSNG